jgi:hypothetical protein
VGFATTQNPIINLAMGTDQTLWGIDSQTNLLEYNWSSSSWTNKGVTNAGSYPINYLAIGNASNIYALTTHTTNNVFQYSGGSWSVLPGGWWCSQISADAAGDVFCIGVSNNVYQYTAAAGWVALSKTLTNITASGGSVMGVDSSYNVWVWDPTTSAWTETTATTLGFNILQQAGSIAAGGDGSVAAIGTQGNIRVSHDGGQTFTAVAKPSGWGSSTPLWVVSPSAQLTSAVGPGGLVFHLNSLIPQLTAVVNGTCGSACAHTTDQVSVNNHIKMPNTTSGDQGFQDLVGCSGDYTGQTDYSDGESCFNLASVASVNQNLGTLIGNVQCDSLLDNSPCDYTYAITVVDVTSGLTVLSLADNFGFEPVTTRITLTGANQTCGAVTTSGLLKHMHRCIYSGVSKANFTPKCVSADSPPDYNANEIFDNTNSAGTGPPTGLWGFDMTSSCFYTTFPYDPPAFCISRPGFKGAGWWEPIFLPPVELISPGIPSGTLGNCTHNGAF